MTLAIVVLPRNVRHKILLIKGELAKNLLKYILFGEKQKIPRVSRPIINSCEPWSILKIELFITIILYRPSANIESFSVSDTSRIGYIQPDNEVN